MVNLDIHHKPENLSDKVALAFTKLLRFIADTFFKKKYGHRAVVLETVAAVPGMVGGMLIHLFLHLNFLDIPKCKQPCLHYSLYKHCFFPMFL